MPNPLAAQAGAKIIGEIVISGSVEPVAGAAVFLEPGNFFAESDQNGFFEFSGLNSGTYHLLIQRIAYFPVRRQSIFLLAGETKKIKLEMNEKILEAADSITVTARRNPFTTMEIPNSRDMVTGEQLNLSRPLNLAEAMQTIQGTFIKDYGSVGSLKTISLRGSAAEQVVVMLDGQKLNDPQTGQIDLSNIRLDGIESIEILRGGSSAIYGADAVGGVINIMSKKTQKVNGLKAHLDLMGGAFNSASINSELDLTQDWFSGLVGFSRLYSQGDFNFANLLDQEVSQTNNDISSRNIYTSLNFKLQPSPDKLDLNLFYRYYEAERGIPGTLEIPLPTTRQWDTNQQFGGTLQGNIVNALHTFHLRADGFKNQFRYLSKDGLVPVDSRLVSGANNFEMGMETILTPNNSLTYGLGLKVDWMINQTFSFEKNRKNGYAYLQDEATIPLHLFDIALTCILIPALRLDYFSDLGPNWSPKLGGTVSSGTKWQMIVRFNTGLSFRAPTFNELFWPADFWSRGNPDLQPEKGFDWDIGIGLRYPLLDGFTFDVVYFSIHMQDLILWQPTGQIWQPENVSKSQNEGVELRSSLKIFNEVFKISGNYTFLEATNQTDIPVLTGKHLIYRPRHTFNLGMLLDWQSLKCGFDYRFVGKRYVNPANTIYLEAYQISDLTLRWRQTFSDWQTEIMVQVKNVFDQAYQAIRFQPMPGTEIRIGLSLYYD